ncbi:MAG TPA: BrnA antitoxin family protein [Rubrivivax sp.]|nr:BrnA antitoxin family protein [Rubrivivax sp.]
MPRKPNPELADDDAPELTAQWFEKAKPASKVLPPLFGKSSAAELLKPRRARPTLEKPKEHVNIRLDADIVQAFKSKGRGWQTRVNSALREWLRSRSR